MHNVHMPLPYRVAAKAGAPKKKRKKKGKVKPCDLEALSALQIAGAAGTTLRG
jgi:hypothetical protein